jgi:hypothetical protein
MTFLKVLLVVVAVIWLISLVRLGGTVRYSEDGLMVRLILGPARITLFPRKKKEAKPKKPPKEKKKKPPKEEAEAEQKGGALPPVMKLLPLVGEAAGQLKRKIRIDDLTVHLTWASADPFQTAMGFGGANAAMGMIWPLIDNNFKVKRHDLGVAVDFDGKSPTIYCLVSLTMTVGQLVAFGVHFGVKFLMIWSRSRKGSVKKQEVSHEREQSSHQ